MVHQSYSFRLLTYHVWIPLFGMVCSVSDARSQSSQTSAQTDATHITVSLSATGHSTGHIANLGITNSGHTTFEMTLPPAIIASDGITQGYVVPDPVRCGVPPSQTIHIAVNGFCLDHYLPVPPVNTALPMPTQWSGLPHIEGNLFDKDPFDSIRIHTGGDSIAHKPMGAESMAKGDGVAFAPKQPSLDVVGSETAHVQDGQRKYVSRTPAEDARLLDEVDKILRSVDSLQQKAETKTPLTKNPPVEKSVIIQHTIWVAASPPEQPYTMSDICEDLDQTWQSITGSSVGKSTPPDYAALLDVVFKAGSGAGITSFLPQPPAATNHYPKSFPSSGHPAEQTVKVTGTGRTTGHIADITIRNPTDQPVMATIGSGRFYIPSTGQYQPYIVPDMPPIALGPGESKTVPVNGYCVDIHRPPVPSGSGMPDIKEWTSVPGTPPDEIPGNAITIPTRLSPPIGDALELIGNSIPPVLTSSDPDCIPYSANTPFISLLPGTNLPLPDPDILNAPGDAYLLAPVLLTTIQRITDAYDEMHERGDIITPFSGNPDREREAVIQQTFWMYTGGMNGETYHKKDFFETTVRQFEDNTQRDYEALPTEQKEKIESGVDDFWNSFEAVGVEAKVIRVPDPPAAVPPQGWDAYPAAQQKQPPLPVASADDRTTQPVPPPEHPKVPPETEKECIPKFTLDAAPPMRGGLHPKCVGTFRIAKGEFIPLIAEGADADQIFFDCIPGAGCPESGSQRKEGLTSCVSYYWDESINEKSLTGIISNTSSYVEQMKSSETFILSGLNKAILYQHAEVTREKPNIESRLELTIYDECKSQAYDVHLKFFINIFVHLVENPSGDSVDITIVAPVFDAYNNPVKTEALGTCEAKPLAWTQTKDLDIETSPKTVFEESKNVLSAAANDTDQLELRCSSTCKGSIKTVTLPDEVIFQWEILSGGGCFMTGPTTCQEMTWGKDVVFFAPSIDGFTESVTVKILVKAYNQGGGTDPYKRTPVISKAIDAIDTDTLTIKVLCRARGETKVVIGWADRFWDHDDPDHIDTLKNTKQSASITYNEECQVNLEQAEEAWNQETYYSQFETSGFVPNAWFGYRHLYAVGNIVYLYDYGFIYDLNIPIVATEWLEEFKEIMGLGEGVGKVLAWALHRLPQFREGNVPEFWDEVAKAAGIGPEVWKEGNLDEFAQSLLINEVLKTLQERPFIQNRELGFIFSSWVLSPGSESDCDSSCPIDVSHQTVMTLGDSDHYYRRTSQVIVTRQVGNQIVHEPHSFEKELKGERFPR